MRFRGMPLASVLGGSVPRGSAHLASDTSPIGPQSVCFGIRRQRFPETSPSLHVLQALGDLLGSIFLLQHVVLSIGWDTDVPPL
jgi:hypothetical protein